VASVTDDAEPERRRRSFEAIDERVRQVHGKIEVLADGDGTEVRVTLPSYTAQR
jgi:signal transduction histidine kinase